MARTPVPGTQERILDVAARLFYAHGIRAVGMNQIIDMAGTGKNLLYTHFPTKADLVVAYLEQVRGKRQRAAAAAVDAAGDDPGAGLVALVAEVGGQVRRPHFRGCAFRNYLVEFPADEAPPDGGDTGPEAVARRMLRDSRARIDDLTTRLVGSENADVLAEQIWLIVDGLYIRAAYRARLDGAPADAVDAAVGLARRIVDDARP